MLQWCTRLIQRIGAVSFCCASGLFLPCRASFGISAGIPLLPLDRAAAMQTAFYPSQQPSPGSPRGHLSLIPLSSVSPHLPSSGQLLAHAGAHAQPGLVAPVLRAADRGAGD